MVLRSGERKDQDGEAPFELRELETALNDASGKKEPPFFLSTRVRH